MSHAGRRTMLGAICSGVPMVVVEIGADQPINARRAADPGIAIALTTTKTTVSRLHDATETVLRDGSYRAMARSFREERDMMDPIEQVVAADECIGDGVGELGNLSHDRFSATAVAGPLCRVGRLAILRPAAGVDGCGGAHGDGRFRAAYARFR